MMEAVEDDPHVLDRFGLHFGQYDLSSSSSPSETNHLHLHHPMIAQHQQSSSNGAVDFLVGGASSDSLSLDDHLVTHSSSSSSAAAQNHHHHFYNDDPNLGSATNILDMSNGGVYDSSFASTLTATIDLDHHHHADSSSSLNGTPPVSSNNIIHQIHHHNNGNNIDHNSGMMVGGGEGAIVANVVENSMNETPMFEGEAQNLSTSTSPNDDKKSCTCKDCGKVFNSVWYLKQHAVKHSSERPFKCKYCHKTYRFRSNLYQHKCPLRDRASELASLALANGIIDGIGGGHGRKTSSSTGGGAADSPHPSSESSSSVDICGAIVPGPPVRTRKRRVWPPLTSPPASTGGSSSSTTTTPNGTSSTMATNGGTSAATAATSTMASVKPNKVKKGNHHQQHPFPIVGGNGAIVAGEGEIFKWDRINSNHNGTSSLLVESPVCSSTNGSTAIVNGNGQQHPMVSTMSEEEVQKFLDRHKDKLHKCAKCKTLWPSREYLTRHMEWHNDDSSRFRCVQCSETFVDEHRYGLHKQNHSPAALHVCARCRGKFVTRVALKKHSRRCSLLASSGGEPTRHVSASVVNQQQQQQQSNSTSTSKNGHHRPALFFDPTPPPSPRRPSTTTTEDESSMIEAAQSVWPLHDSSVADQHSRNGDGGGIANGSSASNGQYNGGSKGGGQNNHRSASFNSESSDHQESPGLENNQNSVEYDSSAFVGGQIGGESMANLANGDRHFGIGSDHDFDHEGNDIDEYAGHNDDGSSDDLRLQSHTRRRPYFYHGTAAMVNGRRRIKMATVVEEMSPNRDAASMQSIEEISMMAMEGAVATQGQQQPKDERLDQPKSSQGTMAYCSMCQIRFIDQRQLTEHMSKVHKVAAD